MNLKLLLVEIGDILILIGLAINAYGLHNMNKMLIDHDQQIKQTQVESHNDETN